MKTALAVTCSALALGIEAAPVPQSIPTVILPPASAKSTLALWSVAGVRQVAGGQLIVNDQVGREVRLFDSTLANSVVTVDSNSYGARRPRALPLIRFTGDSSLLADPQARTVRVLDGRGRLARTAALPDGPFNLAGTGYVDDKGRVLFAARPVWLYGAGADSTLILRADLARGRVDTVGRVKTNDGRPFNLRPFTNDTTNRAAALWLPNLGQQALVPSRDDWGVLSDGSIAFVRGHDYHIDWIRADGTMSSTPKLPFDWQRLADDNKKQMADSSLLKARVVRRGALGDSLGLRLYGDSVARRLMLDKTYKATLGLYNLTLAPGSDATAVIPDMDGNLWILPSASQMQAGEAVYDVVNGKGELFQRVRVPAGKTIAGFARGGVVYLSSGDRQNGFYIERTRFVAAPK